MDKMRRDFDTGRKPNSRDAEPEQFSPEKQNHRTDQHAQNWNRQVHRLVMSTGVETSLGISEIARCVDRNSKRFLDFARDDTGEGFLRFLAIPARQIAL